MLLYFQGSSATCPVCRKNARIRRLLCVPLTSPEHILQAVTQQTSASTIQLLRSILDPNYENQHNLSTSEDQSCNRQLYSDQANNRLNGILLHYHENIRRILDLANEAQEIIQQSALVSMEITFIEEYQELLYQTAPETQLPYLPSSTYNHHLNPPYSPARRPFRQRMARSAPSEQRMPNTSGLMNILAGLERIFLLPQPLNIRRRRRMRHPGSAQRQCISLKVFGSDAVRVPTYFFHAPTDDCHHSGKFYLEHLDSSSPDCLTAHRYVMCSPPIEKQDDPQIADIDSDTEENRDQVRVEPRDRSSEVNDAGNVFSESSVPLSEQPSDTR